MSAAAKVILFASVLVVVFGVMFLAGRALVPDETVATWTREAQESNAGHQGMDEHQTSAAPAHVSGLAIEEGGYRLSEIEAPTKAGKDGSLSFRILGPGGDPVTDFTENHEKELHLITVRTDGEEFRHVHPRLDSTTGEWTVPWRWNQGGSYRLFTDFVPGDSAGSENLTLSRGFEAAGEYQPANRETSRSDEVDGFDVEMQGDLVAGEAGMLTAVVTRDGEPVTTLQPYLGAFGHLVALREGDLAYLHVHAETETDGEEGEHGHGDSGGHTHGGPTAGPEIRFSAEAPTPGRYFLYLDFKVDGQVHTAEFVLEAK